jgi:hypothetical protein
LLQCQFSRKRAAIPAFIANQQQGKITAVAKLNVKTGLGPAFLGRQPSAYGFDAAKIPGDSYRQTEKTMAKRGRCWLCGKETDRLTADHTQPQCAFNEKKRRYLRLNSVVNRRRPLGKIGHAIRNIYMEIQPDRPIAGGIYYNRQCLVCNSLLGRCYDARFGQWCRDAHANLKRGAVHVVQQEYTQRCKYPLSILKRIVAMFFSINGERFAEAQPELSRFARFPLSHEFPEKIGLFAAYNTNDLVSHIPCQVRFNPRTCAQVFLSQIAHPPFVFLLTLDGPCPDPRLTDLRRFAEYNFEDEADVEVTFRVLPTNSCFAGDYRATGKLVPDDTLVMTPEVEPSFFRLIDEVV